MTGKENTNHQKPPASSRLVELAGLEPANLLPARLTDYGFETVPSVQADATEAPSLSPPRPGRKQTAATRAKITAALKGRPLSLEARAALTGRHLSAETRAKIAASRRGRRHSAEARAKIARAKQGAQNPEWKGGVRKKGCYLLELCHGHPAADRWGYVYQHRLVMERILGRYLTPHEVVHHLDGNPLNNDPANLWLLSHGEHKRLHHRISRLNPRVPAARFTSPPVRSGGRGLLCQPRPVTTRTPSSPNGPGQRNHHLHVCASVGKGAAGEAITSHTISPGSANNRGAPVLRAQAGRSHPRRRE